MRAVRGAPNRNGPRCCSPSGPLRVSWGGRGELGTLHAVEPAQPATEIAGDRFMAGFYLNELVLVFTRRGEPHPDLFAHYTAALADLGVPGGLEASLRQFEIALLAETGYGLSLERDADTGAPLQDSQLYRYVADRGPVAVRDAGDRSLVFSGAELKCIGAGSFADVGMLRTAKRLLRHVLRYHLGDRELKTRGVMAEMLG